MIRVPIRLDRMQTAMVSTLTEALSSLSPAPRVYWGRTEPTREQLPPSSVALSMVSGPAPSIRSGARGELLNPTSSIPITVTAVVAGQKIALRLNCYDYSTVVIVGDTVTTIRDRLRDAVNADTLEATTASDLAADGVTLAADYNGAMRELELIGSLSAGTPIASDTSVLVTEGTQTMLVSVQAYSKNAEPWNGAENLTAICYSAFQTQSVVETLILAGVGIQTKGTPTSIPMLVGGSYESRSSFDVQLSMHSAWVKDVERIETVVVDINASGITTQQIITP